MSEQVALGFVGCGSMAGAHLRGLRRLWEAGLRDFRVVATCDLDRERAAKFAQDVAEIQGAAPTVYTDYEKMLAQEQGLEAVDIIVVHRDHHALALPCLEAGKHVTIEKPLAFTMRAGRLMLEAAQRSGRVLQVAENYRRSPEHRAINWALRQGRIGRPRMIYWIDVGERLWYWAWRDHKEQAGGGWMLDGGVHFADLFRYHLGPVRQVQAISATFNPFRYEKPDLMEGPIPASVEDAVIALLWFDGGVVGQWTSTMAAPGESWSRRIIYGEEGSLDFGKGITRRGGRKTSLQALVREYMKRAGAQEKARNFPGGVTDTVATELQEFFQAVRGRCKVEIDGREGYRAQAVCFAVYESALAGKPTKTSAIESLKVEAYQKELNALIGL